MAQTPRSRLCKGFEGGRKKAYGWKKTGKTARDKTRKQLFQNSFQY